MVSVFQETWNEGEAAMAEFIKLPVGIEVYDERGQLVDLNRTDENLFAISRKDIMGINLFENPNFPEDKIARLKQGEMVVLDCNYEFDNIQRMSTIT